MDTELLKYKKQLQLFDEDLEKLGWVDDSLAQFLTDETECFDDCPEIDRARQLIQEYTKLLQITKQYNSYGLRNRVKKMDFYNMRRPMINETLFNTERYNVLREKMVDELMEDQMGMPTPSLLSMLEEFLWDSFNNMDDDQLQDMFDSLKEDK